MRDQGSAIFVKNLLPIVITNQNKQQIALATKHRPVRDQMTPETIDSNRTDAKHFP